MSYRILFVCIVISFFQNCKNETQSQLETAQKEVEEILPFSEHESWVTAFNEGVSLANYYTEQAVKMDASGNYITSAAKIDESYASRSYQIDSYYVDKRLEANKTGNILYEVGGFHTSSGEEIKHLIIWRKADDKLLREFEVFETVKATEAKDAIIDQRREQWMTHCNNHDVDALVTDLYTSNAVYYNHRPVIVGREAIISEYRYMTNPQYSLKLDPWVFETVSDSVVYEIGQCSGSYGGKYVLFWVKDSDGIWRVLMDSNI